MKIEKSKVTKLRITEVKSLDPVTVFIENMGLNQGKILIECFSESWASYWGAMGDCKIEQFFTDCNNDYLIGCLARGLRPTIYNEDNKPEANYKYEYLSRIVDAVKEAIKETDL